MHQQQGKPAMPKPSMTVPWDSNPGMFSARISDGHHQTIQQFQAQSLDQAVTEALKRFRRWQPGSTITVVRLAGGERWMGPLT